MVKGNFKQIDLLRNRRDSNNFVDPYFIDNRKYIKKGVISGLTLIVISLILGIPFVFRTKFLEDKKEKIKIFSDEYNILEKKLDKEQKQLKVIANFNKDLKNEIINISSSSALLQEIALIIPREIQLIDLKSKGNSLYLKANLPSSNYLETLNSFLINLNESELVKFDEIDLKEIKAINNSSEDNSSENNSYSFDIKTRISTKYYDINEKYLIKLGSYGLFQRLTILKNIEESFD